MKTAKSTLDITPNMVSLDGQLRKYAWVSGITEVGFLNFVKCKTDDFKKGTAVTLLGDYGDTWASGQRLVVVSNVEMPEGSEDKYLNVATAETVQIMDEELDKISGKGSKEKKELLFSTYANKGWINTVKRENVTKVRVQFVRGTIPESELPEIGDQIGLDVLSINESNRRGLFPADGGVRFPNQTCTWCEMRGICLKDTGLRDNILVQIKPKQAEEDDWLKELENDSE